MEPSNKSLDAISHGLEQIFNFNNVSEKLTDEEINELKSYYKTNHKKCWVYKKAYKKYRKWKLIANSLSIIFASGGLAGAIATNGIALVAITSVALLIQSYMKHKNLDINIKTCQNAYLSYNELLNEIKTSLRTGYLNRDILTLTMTKNDNIAVSNCPIVDKYETKYHKVFK